MPAKKRKPPAKRSLLRKIKVLEAELNTLRETLNWRAAEERKAIQAERNMSEYYFQQERERRAERQKLIFRERGVEHLMRYLADPENYKRYEGRDCFVEGYFAYQSALQYFLNIDYGRQALAEIRSEMAQGIVTRLEASPTDTLREEIAEIRRNYVKGAA